MIFDPKAWFRNMLNPYLKVIKTQLNNVSGSGSNLTEYIDSDKPSPAIGEQWIRINTKPYGVLVGFCGGMPIINYTPTVQLRTNTSQGVI